LECGDSSPLSFVLLSGLPFFAGGDSSPLSLLILRVRNRRLLQKRRKGKESGDESPHSKKEKVNVGITRRG
jgi:hypothetical protein